MAFDIKKWLTEELQLSGDDLALVETKLAPKAQIIEQGYLRQSDYSTKMNEINGLRDEIAAKDARLTAEAVEWANMTAAEQARNGDLRASIEKHEQEQLRLRQRLERVATTAGISKDEAFKDLDQEPIVPTVPPVDLSKHVTIDQHRALAGLAVRLPAQLAAIAREHKALTGQDIDEIAVVSELEKRAGTRGNQKSLDLRDVWEEMHDIPAKRAAKAEATRQAELTAAREEGRMQALSEASVPGGSAPRGKAAPVFLREGHGTSKLQRPQPGSGIGAAVAAFDSGKYRQKSA